MIYDGGSLEVSISQLGPARGGAFCFLMCLRGYSDSLAGVITSHSCGVAAWTNSGEAETTVTRTFQIA